MTGENDDDVTKIYVLYTGGTFGMMPDESKVGSPLSPVSLLKLEEKLKPIVQQLEENTNSSKKIDVTMDQFEHLIDSSSMKPRYWLDMAKKIYDNYDKYDGFVIIQGTDTLSYTSSALSFIFENLGKPVVVTGSQLPLSNPRTDASLNFGHAVLVAAYKASDLPLIPEVVVVFADKVIRGCRTRKMSASSWTGFESPNAPLLGEIGEHIKIYEDRVRPAPSPDLKLQLNDELDERVLDISLYPGLQPDHLRKILELDNVEGVVLRTYGSGNAPEEPDFIEALREGINKNGKTVVNISQCPQGSVEMGLYAASVKLLDCGVISGLDMTPEAALTKLMVTMASRVGNQVKLQMQVNQRGEQSQNLFDLNFDEKIELNDESFSSFVIPDRRFKPNELSTTVLRLHNVKTEIDKTMWPAKTTDADADNKKPNGPNLYVFMNSPRAILDEDTSKHARCVATINISGDSGFEIVETLSKEKIRNVIGDSDIVLTFVPDKGVKFKFDKLSLSMFTQA